MPQRVVRGNDLTGHEVIEYDLGELRDTETAADAVEQALRGIDSYAAIIENFHVAKGSSPEDAEVDSTATLSSEIQRKVAQLREFMANPSERNLAIIGAVAIGQLHERLRWMWLHGGSARKGHQRTAHERLAQQSGAEANKRKARDAVSTVANVLKTKLQVDLLKAMSDAALARQVTDADLGGKRTERTVRNYIALARQRGLLPRRLEM